MEAINLSEKFSQFSDHWNPRIAAELNGQHVKLAKFRGEFIWHRHEHEDELFLVVKGEFTMQFRDKQVLVKEGSFIVVPRGVEHCPKAENEVWVMLFEPVSTLNTGDQENELTRTDLGKI